MRRSIRLVIAAGAALTALAVTGSAWAAYTPRLVVTSLNNSPGQPTTILLGHVQNGPRTPPDDDATFRDQIYAPLGYGVNLSAPVNTKVGDVEATLVLRNGGNAEVDVEGQVVADNPALYTAQAQQCTQSATPPEAVWRLDVTVAGTPLRVPIYVNRTTGPEAAFASAKIQLCLAGPVGTPAGAQLLFALFDVNGVFTNPSTTTDRIWRAVFVPYFPGTATPNPTQSVEGQALVPGRVSFTLTAKSLRRGRVILSGRLLVDGQAFPNATIDLYVGTRRVGRTKTNRAGRFTFRKRIRKKTRYQTLVAVFGDLTVPPCPATTPPLPTAQGCKTATTSFVAVSRRVTARRRR